MWRERQRLGRRGEQLAAQWLVSHGYQIEAANVRFPVGELDLVAWQDETLCFIEVRSVSSTEWGGAAASVTDAKRRRLRRAAEWYLAHKPLIPKYVRFDVVAITWDGSGAPQVDVIQGAVTADD